MIHVITEMCDCVTDRGGGPGRRPRESHLGQSAERDGRRNTETGAATLRRATNFSLSQDGDPSFSQRTQYFAIHWTVFVIFISSVEKFYSYNAKKIYESKKIRSKSEKN